MTTITTDKLKNVAHWAARKAGLDDKTGMLLGILMTLGINQGEWGTLHWYAPGDKPGFPSFTRAMPRHEAADGTWRFTSDSGFEMFIDIDKVVTFEPEAS